MNKRYNVIKTQYFHLGRGLVVGSGAYLPVDDAIRVCNLMNDLAIDQAYYYRIEEVGNVQELQGS